MSQATKTAVEEVKRHFKKVENDAGQLSTSITFDKELSNKIRKVKKSATEVVKHIEERINK